ncbi:MAG: hypothetical protein ACI4LM_06025 [Anaerovoracaceae bacterium]|jgi:lipopolysaccharide export LptBFGC system permease protein LptF
MSYGRFHTRKTHRIRNMIIAVCIFAAVIAFFSYAVGTVRSSSVNNQEKNLKAALERDITDSYASTGSYPQSLDEIKDRYGLVYDEDLFFVDYQVRGSNIRPEVTIIRKKGDPSSTGSTAAGGGA